MGISLCIYLIVIYGYLIARTKRTIYTLLHQQRNKKKNVGLGYFLLCCIIEDQRCRSIEFLFTLFTRPRFLNVRSSKHKLQKKLILIKKALIVKIINVSSYGKYSTIKRIFKRSQIILNTRKIQMNHIYVCLSYAKIH